jgi:hypothetical protein
MKSNSNNSSTAIVPFPLPEGGQTCLSGPNRTEIDGPIIPNQPISGPSAGIAYFPGKRRGSVLELLQQSGVTTVPVGLPENDKHDESRAANIGGTESAARRGSVFQILQQTNIPTVPIGPAKDLETKTDAKMPLSPLIEEVNSGKQKSGRTSHRRASLVDLMRNGVATPVAGAEKAESPKTTSEGKRRFVNAVKATINSSDMVQKRVENEKQKRRTSAAHIDLVNHFKIRRYSSVLTPEVVSMMNDEANDKKYVSIGLFNPNMLMIRCWEMFALALVLAQAVYIPLLISYDINNV